MLFAEIHSRPDLVLAGWSSASKFGADHGGTEKRKNHLAQNSFHTPGMATELR